MMGPILAVAPHHDDECLGCGGLLAVAKRSGVDTHIVTVFGPLARDGSDGERRRVEEAAAAARVLGALRMEDLRLPCRAEVSDEIVTWRLVEVIRAVGPAVLLIPHGAERDPEHCKTHRAALESAWLSEAAYRGTPGGRIECILGYEVWTPIANPPITIDISATIETKLDALRCYKSQLEVTDLVHAAQGLARYRGTMRIGCAFGESYTVERVSERALRQGGLF